MDTITTPDKGFGWHAKSPYTSQTSFHHQKKIVQVPFIIELAVLELPTQTAA